MGCVKLIFHLSFDTCHLLLFVPIRVNFVDRSYFSGSKRSTKQHETPRNEIQKMANEKCQIANDK